MGTWLSDHVSMDTNSTSQADQMATFGGNGAKDGQRPAHSFQRLPLDLPGAHPVDVPIVCVLTRIGLSSVRYLLPTFLDYRRVMAQIKATQTPGLLRAAFLIENAKTCISLSIWADWEAIARFGTNVPYHVTAARRVFGRVSFNKGRGPEVWSTKSRLMTVSNNLSWGDFDLRELILGMSP